MQASGFTTQRAGGPNPVEPTRKRTINSDRSCRFPPLACACSYEQRIAVLKFELDCVALLGKIVGVYVCAIFMWHVALRNNDVSDSCIIMWFENQVRFHSVYFEFFLYWRLFLRIAIFVYEIESGIIVNVFMIILMYSLKKSEYRIFFILAPFWYSFYKCIFLSPTTMFKSKC